MSVQFTKGATTITLNSPEHGDGERYNTNMSFFIMMNGDVSNYKGKKQRTYLLTFTGVKRTIMDAFIAFYVTNINETVVYKDPLGTNHNVKILNNPLDTSVSRGSGDCEWLDFTLQLGATL